MASYRGEGGALYDQVVLCIRDGRAQSENAEYTKTSAEYKQATPGSRASAVPQYEWISWRTRLQAMRRNDHEMRGWLQH